MAKFQSPLLGYNNNVRHRGRQFHIQTEDSGVNHPHIITHLFMDGGRILKSVKTSYAEHVGADGMSETVRVMMKEQHKAMFIALRDGQFDSLVDGAKEAAAAKDAAVAAAKAAAADKKATDAAASAAVPAPAPSDTASITLDSNPDVASVAAAADAKDESGPEIDVGIAEITLGDQPAPVVDAEIAAAAVAPSPVNVVVVATNITMQSIPTSAAPQHPSLVSVNASAVVPLVSIGASVPPSDPNPNPNAAATIGEKEETAPLTIPESRRPGVSQIPSHIPSSHDIDLPPEVAALLAEEPPAPAPMRRPTSRPPQSTTDPSYAMPAPPQFREESSVHSANAPAMSVAISSGPSTLRDDHQPQQQQQQQQLIPPQRRPSAEELTLDFDALERDSQAGGMNPIFRSQDLPPPPKNLFTKERGTGTYRAVESDDRVDPRSESIRTTTQRERTERGERSDRTDRSGGGDRIDNRTDRVSVVPPSRPQPSSNPRAQSRGSASPQPPRTAIGALRGATAGPPPTTQPKPGGEARYAPARPAAIFGAKPAPSSSIFNDDLVGDESLDEVILSYLAEDLDPPRRK